MSDKVNAFETIDVIVRASGRTGVEYVLNTVDRFGVTPPEYVLLTEIHGEHSVEIVNIGDAAKEKDGFTKKGKQKYRIRTRDDEVTRLRNWYGPSLFGKMFTGKRPQLPYTFDEVGFNIEQPDNVVDIGVNKDQQEEIEKLTEALKAAQEKTDAAEEALKKANKK